MSRSFGPIEDCSVLRDNAGVSRGMIRPWMFCPLFQKMFRSFEHIEDCSVLRDDAGVSRGIIRPSMLCPFFQKMFRSSDPSEDCSVLKDDARVSRGMIRPWMFCPLSQNFFRLSDPSRLLCAQGRCRGQQRYDLSLDVLSPFSKNVPVTSRTAPHSGMMPGSAEV